MEGLQGKPIATQKRHPDNRTPLSYWKDREQELGPLTEEVAKRLSMLNAIGFHLCVHQWLLRTYIPVGDSLDLLEDAVKIGGLPVYAYRSRYTAGADEYRPIFVIVADHPNQVTKELVHRFRSYAKFNQGFVSFIFCQRPIAPSVLSLPAEEEDLSVLIIADSVVAEIMVDKGVGVRPHPLWSFQGPNWEIDDKFFELLQSSRS